jgi:flagellar basal-body rod protein FlgF
MDNAGYVALTRQAGLWSEMRVVANNIANAQTAGFRAEGVLFSEYVRSLGRDAPSLSMAAARVRETSFAQGTLAATGGAFDLAIEGEGFFLVQTPDGQRLTRAGAFTPNENGDLVTAEGHPVLDPGGAPVFVPAGTGPVAIAPDGTISADGQPVGQIGLFLPADPRGLVREDGVRFRADGGIVPAEGGRMLQGFLEGSNVDPVLQIARMIEVQRAYELGQGFLDREDERIRSVIRAMNRGG